MYNQIDKNSFSPKPFANTRKYSSVKPQNIFFFIKTLLYFFARPIFSTEILYETSFKLGLSITKESYFF